MVGVYSTQLEWIFRLLYSALIGAVIGYERHNRAKEAGVRTHSIVALASTMLMIVSQYGFPDASKFDAARIASQIVPGISFLGAGIIFVRNDTIQGLTTAAGIWATAGIGMTIGSGMYLVGTCAGILIVVIQTMLHGTRYITGTRMFMNIVIQVDKNCHIREIIENMDRHDLDASDIHIKPDPDDENRLFLNLEISSAKSFEPDQIFSIIRKIPGVLNIQLK